MAERKEKRAFVPGFEYDLFISYAHLDNEEVEVFRRPDPQLSPRWVDHFHRKLKQSLQGHLGAEIAVWRDPKLGGLDEFTGEIQRRLHRSAALVSILTPRYLNSTWCMRECREFVHRAEASGRLMVDGKLRVAQVFKLPVATEGLPEAIREVSLGCRFYEEDEASGGVVQTHLRSDVATAFPALVDDLAQDLKSLLSRMRELAEQEADPRAAIYLARPSSELRDDCDKIRRELEDRGIVVLPSEDDPIGLETPSADIEARIERDLGRCAVSIHPMGNHYGVVPEGEKRRRSIGHLELRLAGLQAGTSALRRVVWVPSGVEPADDSQRDLIAGLRDGQGNIGDDPLSESTIRGITLLEREREEVITYLVEALSEPEPDTCPTNGDYRHIYLIYDPCDRAIGQTLSDFLFEKGFEVDLPVTEGSEEQRLWCHQENLLLCDASLILFGKASEAWVRLQAVDHRKARGWEIERRVAFKEKAAQGVYLDEPRSEVKERYQSREFLILNQDFERFAPGLLDEFLERLQ